VRVSGINVLVLPMLILYCTANCAALDKEISIMQRIVSVPLTAIFISLHEVIVQDSIQLLLIVASFGVYMGFLLLTNSVFVGL